MKFNTNDLMPWADIANMLTRMKRMTVTLNGKPLGPEMDMSMDDEGHVTMSFEKAKK